MEGRELLRGQSVSDEQIQEWVDPVGDESGAVIPVRFNAAIASALNSRAEAEGIEKCSDVIRAAVGSWGFVRGARRRVPVLKALAPQVPRRKGSGAEQTGPADRDTDGIYPCVPIAIKDDRPNPDYPGWGDRR